VAKSNHALLSRSVLFATIKVKKPRASTILAEAFPHVEAFMRQPFYRYAAIRSQSHTVDQTNPESYGAKLPHKEGTEGHGAGKNQRSSLRILRMGV
jgi:hypothetical protein